MESLFCVDISPRGHASHFALLRYLQLLRDVDFEGLEGKSVSSARKEIDRMIADGVKVSFFFGGQLSPNRGCKQYRAQVSSWSGKERETRGRPGVDPTRNFVVGLLSRRLEES